MLERPRLLLDAVTVTVPQGSVAAATREGRAEQEQQQQQLQSRSGAATAETIPLGRSGPQRHLSRGVLVGDSETPPNLSQGGGEAGCGTAPLKGKEGAGAQKKKEASMFSSPAFPRAPPTPLSPLPHGCLRGKGGLRDGGLRVI